MYLWTFWDASFCDLYSIDLYCCTFTYHVYDDLLLSSSNVTLIVLPAIACWMEYFVIILPLHILVLETQCTA